MFIKLVVLLFLLVSFNLNADVYKWVDKNGQVHYSNKASKKGKKSAKKIKFKKYKKPDKSTEIAPPVPEDWSDYSTEAPIKKIKRKPKIKEPTIEELKVRCELAREKRLAPVREEEIEKCVEKNKDHMKRPREYCERYYRYFGNAEISPRGRTLRLFHNIPECRRLYRAEDKRSRLRRGYSD